MEMKDTYSTVIVDLTRSEDEIFKSIEKSARNGITKAQREGLIIKNTGISEEHYQMYQSTMEEGGSEPQTIEEIKSHMLVFFSCIKDGKVIAIASLHLENGRCTLQINSSLKEYQKYQPNNLLYWECILWAKAHGYKELDLGGWQQNSFDEHLTGINRFKEKWGKIVTYDKEYPLLHAIGRKAIKKSRLLWNINKKIRGRK